MPNTLKALTIALLGLLGTLYLGGYFFLLFLKLPAVAATPLTIPTYAYYYWQRPPVRARLIGATGLAAVLLGGLGLIILVPKGQSLYGNIHWETRRGMRRAGLFSHEGIILGKVGRRFLVLPGQTGVILAELLGLPHSTLILHVEKTDAGLKVKRELEEGWFQSIEMPLPAVLTMQSGGNKLRYATLMGIKRAKTKELRAVSAGELGVEAAPTVTLEQIAVPKKQKSTQILGGSAKEAAAALVEKLKTEARVL